MEGQDDLWDALNYLKCSKEIYHRKEQFPLCTDSLNISQSKVRCHNDNNVLEALHY